MMCQAPQAKKHSSVLVGTRVAGADPGILVRGGVKVAGLIDRQHLFLKFIYFIDLITFRHTKPGYLNCSNSGVSKKWSAIFVQCLVPETYFCF